MVWVQIILVIALVAVIAYRIWLQRQLITELLEELMSETYRNPETDHEWQVAADMAQTALDIDAARKYGLITGGPAVNVERCEEILRLAADRGIEPTEDCVERCLAELMAGEVA